MVSNKDTIKASARCPQGGYSGINVTGGSNVFFWVEDLTVYFFGPEKSARIFLGLNFCQANSSYAIQAKVPARSESMISSLVFFWGAT